MVQSDPRRRGSRPVASGASGWRLLKCLPHLQGCSYVTNRPLASALPQRGSKEARALSTSGVPVVASIRNTTRGDLCEGVDRRGPPQGLRHRSSMCRPRVGGVVAVVIERAVEDAVGRVRVNVAPRPRRRQPQRRGRRSLMSATDVRCCPAANSRRRPWRPASGLVGAAVEPARRPENDPWHTGGVDAPGATTFSTVRARHRRRCVPTAYPMAKTPGVAGRAIA